MAYRSDGDVLEAVLAGADLTDQEMLCVKVDATGRIVLCSVAAEYVTGVLIEGAAIGLSVGVQVGGRVKVKAGAAVPVGSLVAVDAAGKAVVAGIGEKAFGQALSAATAADQILTVDFKQVGA